MTATELTQRIIETYTEIAKKEKRLAELPVEKARLLASNDEVAAVVADEEEQRIVEQLDRLRNRLLVLQGEREAVLKSEAQTRIPELERDMGKVAVRVTEGTRDLRMLLNRVLAYSESLRPPLTELVTLLDEGRYLESRFHTRLPTISHADQLTPDEVSVFLNKIELALKFEPEPSRWMGELHDFRKKIDDAVQRIALRHAQAPAAQEEK